MGFRDLGEGSMGFRALVVMWGLRYLVVSGVW